MPYTLRMPEIAANATHATLVCWNKSEGERISAGQSIADIETDKAVLELPVESAGTIGKLLVVNGTEVAVGDPIAILLSDGESLVSFDHNLDGPRDEVARETDEQQSQANTSSAVSRQGTSARPDSHSSTGNAERSQQRILSSPVARLLARENLIDLKEVQGSGPRGRITKNDVQQHLSQLQTNPASLHPARSAHTPGPKLVASTITAPTSMRRTIARRLHESKTTIPHFYVRVTCNMQELIALREQVNSGRQERISVNDFVIRACAVALTLEPDMNVSWRDDGVHQFEQADVSMAVATPAGLITPIIHNAAELTLSSISRQSKALVEQARNGTLQPEQYQGGTFSVSNLGMYGIDDFDAIINPPQAGILAVGAIRDEPIVKSGSVIAGKTMRCVLSVDHRVVDGAVAARWLAQFKDLIESPLKLLV